uniref:(California timema) hypothetical protein n=1 Tax=Timema californicum TaxID=61474 RepID=A0A7R9P2P7_TIMCA|nr:unnamed protein product [Timema californicum]
MESRIDSIMVLDENKTEKELIFSIPALMGHFLRWKLANTLVVLSSTAEDREIEVRISVGNWKKYMDGRKTNDRTRWLNSPNVYQKVEILETGTPDPKKITKWVADGSPTHSSTPVKIESALMFVPKGTNPREFKKLQQQIKDNRRADKITSGPQSHILEGVSWEEAKKLQVSVPCSLSTAVSFGRASRGYVGIMVGVEDANVTQTGDQVILVGAASKGIIQRGFQHNAMVYKTPYAKNPFDTITDEELEEYKKVIERKQKGESFDEDHSESEPLSSSLQNSRPTNDSVDILKSPLLSPNSAASETEEESKDEPRVLRIETKQAPRPSQAEVVLSDAELDLPDPNVERSMSLRYPVKVADATDVAGNMNRSWSLGRDKMKGKDIKGKQVDSFVPHQLAAGSLRVPNPVHFHIAHHGRFPVLRKPIKAEGPNPVHFHFAKNGIGRGLQKTIQPEKYDTFSKLKSSQSGPCVVPFMSVERESLSDKLKRRWLASSDVSKCPKSNMEGTSFNHKVVMGSKSTTNNNILDKMSVKFKDSDSKTPEFVRVSNNSLFDILNHLNVVSSEYEKSLKLGSVVSNQSSCESLLSTEDSNSSTPRLSNTTNKESHAHTLVNLVDTDTNSRKPALDKLENANTLNKSSDSDESGVFTSNCSETKEIAAPKRYDGNAQVLEIATRITAQDSTNKVDFLPDEISEQNVKSILNVSSNCTQDHSLNGSLFSQNNELLFVEDKEFHKNSEPSLLTDCGSFEPSLLIDCGSVDSSHLVDCDIVEPSHLIDCVSSEAFMNDCYLNRIYPPPPTFNLKGRAFVSNKNTSTNSGSDFLEDKDLMILSTNADSKHLSSITKNYDKDQNEKFTEPSRNMVNIGDGSGSLNSSSCTNESNKSSVKINDNLGNKPHCDADESNESFRKYSDNLNSDNNDNSKHYAKNTNFSEHTKFYTKDSDPHECVEVYTKNTNSHEHIKHTTKDSDIMESYSKDIIFKECVKLYTEDIDSGDHTELFIEENEFDNKVEFYINDSLHKHHQSYTKGHNSREHVEYYFKDNGSVGVEQNENFSDGSTFTKPNAKGYNFHPKSGENSDTLNTTKLNTKDKTYNKRRDGDENGHFFMDASLTKENIYPEIQEEINSYTKLSNFHPQKSKPLYLETYSDSRPITTNNDSFCSGPRHTKTCVTRLEKMALITDHDVCVPETLCEGRNDNFVSSDVSIQKDKLITEALCIQPDFPLVPRHFYQEVTTPNRNSEHDESLDPSNVMDLVKLKRCNDNICNSHTFLKDPTYCPQANACRESSFLCGLHQERDDSCDHWNLSNTTIIDLAHPAQCLGFDTVDRSNLQIASVGSDTLSFELDSCKVEGSSPHINCHLTQINTSESAMNEKSHPNQTDNNKTSLNENSLLNKTLHSQPSMNENSQLSKTLHSQPSANENSQLDKTIHSKPSLNENSQFNKTACSHPSQNEDLQLNQMVISQTSQNENLHINKTERSQPSLNQNLQIDQTVNYQPSLNEISHLSQTDSSQPSENEILQLNQTDKEISRLIEMVSSQPSVNQISQLMQTVSSHPSVNEYFQLNQTGSFQPMTVMVSSFEFLQQPCEANEVVDIHEKHLKPLLNHDISPNFVESYNIINSKALASKTVDKPLNGHSKLGNLDHSKIEQLQSSFDSYMPVTIETLTHDILDPTHLFEGITNFKLPTRESNMHSVESLISNTQSSRERNSTSSLNAKELSKIVKTGTCININSKDDLDVIIDYKDSLQINLDVTSSEDTARLDVTISESTNSPKIDFSCLYSNKFLNLDFNLNNDLKHMSVDIDNDLESEYATVDINSPQYSFQSLLNSNTNDLNVKTKYDTCKGVNLIGQETVISEEISVKVLLSENMSTVTYVHEMELNIDDNELATFETNETVISEKSFPNDNCKFLLEDKTYLVNKCYLSCLNDVDEEEYLKDENLNKYVNRTRVNNKECYPVVKNQELLFEEMGYRSYIEREPALHSLKNNLNFSINEINETEQKIDDFKNLYMPECSTIGSYGPESQAVESYRTENLGAEAYGDELECQAIDNCDPECGSTEIYENDHKTTKGCDFEYQTTMEFVNKHKAVRKWKDGCQAIEFMDEHQKTERQNPEKYDQNEIAGSYVDVQTEDLHKKDWDRMPSFRIFVNEQPIYEVTLTADVRRDDCIDHDLSDHGNRDELNSSSEEETDSDVLTVKENISDSSSTIEDELEVDFSIAEQEKNEELPTVLLKNSSPARLSDDIAYNCNYKDSKYLNGSVMSHLGFESKLLFDANRSNMFNSDLSTSLDEDILLPSSSSVCVEVDAHIATIFKTETASNTVDVHKSISGEDLTLSGFSCDLNIPKSSLYLDYRSGKPLICYTMDPIYVEPCDLVAYMPADSVKDKNKGTTPRSLTRVLNPIIEENECDYDSSKLLTETINKKGSEYGGCPQLPAAGKSLESEDSYVEESLSAFKKQIDSVIL